MMSDARLDRDSGRPPRIAIAGAVESTRRTLANLIAQSCHLVGVLGLSAQKASVTSGYASLKDLAHAAGVEFREFVDINADSVIDTVRRWRPDLLFVVGLSQMVRAPLLSIPTRGCVGFHPTRLPQGRGRAPLAWLTLERGPGAASFFRMDGGVDSGPLLVQEPFEVTAADDAGSVSRKLGTAIDKALGRWLPELNAGRYTEVPQDPTQATYYGRRAPEDGWIDWNRSAEEIGALVRAATKPHPGAYTYARGTKLIVWKTESADLPWRGVAGRILDIDDRGRLLVQTGAGLLWLTEFEPTPSIDAETPQLKVGLRLGYRTEDEIHCLRREVSELTARLERIEAASHARKEAA